MDSRWRCAIFCGVLLAAAASPLTAQVPRREITLDEFTSEVVAANLDYAAQRYNLSIAETAIAAAKQVQNPSLEMSVQPDVTHGGSGRLPTVYGTGVTQTITTGGKRRYRILNARQNYAASAATLEDFLRNLRLDAAAAFADALALARRVDEKRQSADYLGKLVATQRERFRAGDISQAELLQTEVEEQQFRNEVLAAQSDAEAASMALNRFLGLDQRAAQLVPRGTLAIPPRDFDIAALLSDALERRPDLVALRRSRDAAQTAVRIEEANRIPDVDLSTNWSHSTQSNNSIAPSPAFNAVGLGFSVTLPVWNRNRAAISAARYAAEQSQKQLESAELKAEVELRQAVNTYRNAVERVRRYESGILKNADAVLEARRFSYQQGKSSLLDLLDAQRTANEVRAGYTEALADHANALIGVQRAAQLWDIRF